METRRMCPHCRAFITTSDRVCPYCQEPVAPRRVERSAPAGGILGGFIPHAGYLTILILIINSGLYVATALYSQKGGRGSLGSPDVGTLILFGAKYFGPEVGGPQWWRLVTAGFLHGGLLHILMNMWVLFDLGAQVEELYGGPRMLVLYFVSTVTGFYLSAVWSRAVSMGASAALFGLVGAMLALGFRYRGSAGSLIRSIYGRYLVYLLIFSFLPGIDMAAHIGGLIGGFGVGYLAGRPEYERAPIETFWKAAAGVAVLATLYCFLKWYLWFSSLGQ